MLDEATWDEYRKQREVLWAAFREAYAIAKEVGEEAREAAWEKRDAEMAELRERFNITYEVARDQVTKYTISVFAEGDDPEGHIGLSSWALEVAYRGRNLWAVLHQGYCLSKDGSWDYEPSVTNREDDYLAMHRFNLSEALERARKAAPEVTVNGWTAAELKIELLVKGRIE